MHGKMLLSYNFATMIMLLLLLLSTKITANNTSSETPALANDSLVTNALRTSIGAVTAEKLIRPRRQPPFTIIKHCSKPQRRRQKRPKITYGPPGYHYGEPISYHKTITAPKKLQHHSLPSFSLEGFQHLNFDLPSSSYENQSMDLNLYSNSEHNPLKDSIKYDDIELPEPDFPIEAFEVHKPHSKYGVPSQGDYPDSYHNGHRLATDGPTDYSYFPPHSYDYNYNNNNNKYHHKQIPIVEPPLPPRSQHKPSPGYDSQPSHDYVPLPTSGYGPPVSGSTHDIYDPPSLDYQAQHYDKTFLNAGYAVSGDQHGFAEPPTAYDQDDKSGGIEFNGEQSEDVRLASLQPAYHPSNPHYNQSQSNGGVFAEPPPTVASQPAPSMYPGFLADYLPAPDELPLNPHHKPSAYNFPKSSYEVPIYDPIPFDASNVDEQELYPPNLYDVLRESPKHGDGQEKNNIEPNTDHVPQTESPAHGDKQESEKPHIASENPQKRLRKRKRVRTGTSTSSMKHILDTPELDEAFEQANKQQKYTNDKAERNESSNSKQPKRDTLSDPNAENFSSDVWNPMRIRLPSSMTIASPVAAKSNVVRHTHQKPPVNKARPARQPTPPTLKANSPRSTASVLSAGGLTIFSIAKSRSHSFYGGTVGPQEGDIEPHALKMHSKSFNLTTAPKQVTSQATTTGGSSASAKGTTKSVYDTTYFKRPSTDTARQQLDAAIPQNHKPY